jgi:hypothetical protein
MRRPFLALSFVLCLTVASSYGQTFTRQIYPVGYGTRIERADINGDGKPDIFTYSGPPTLQPSDPHGFSVLLNKGDGTFSSGISTHVAGLLNAQLGDFNNDGKPDAAACVQPSSGSMQLVVFLGDGAGHFTQSSSFAVSTCTISSVGDFNKDGRADIAIATSNYSSGTFLSNTVDVYLGDGAGKLASSPISSTGMGTEPIVLIAAGDLNRDGYPDLGADECCVDDIGRGALLINDGTAHFSARELPQGGRRGRFLKLRDVNQDGFLDLLMQSEDTYDSYFIDLDLFLSQGRSSYSYLLPYQTGNDDGFAGDLFGTDAADFNGDGIKDIGMGQYYWAYEGDEAPIFWENFFYDANQAITAFKSSPQVTVDTRPLDTVWADFDRDGRPDLAVIEYGFGSSPTPPHVEVFLNRTSSAPTCSAANAALRTVALCRPGAGASVTTPTRFLANITSGRPVNQTKIYIDGVSRFTGYDDLINRYLTLPNGQHKITVKAWDAQGSFSTSETIDVTGSTCSAPTTARSVRLCSPTEGNSVWSPVRVIAAVNDSSTVSVQVYVDGVVKFTTTAKKVDWSTSMTTGSHTVMVKTTDGSGSFSASSNFFVE